MSSTSDDEGGEHSNSNSKSKSKVVSTTSTNGQQITLKTDSKELNSSNQDFLKSKLKFIKDDQGRDRCLDQDENMVMASWEKDIMKKTSDLLFEGLGEEKELRVLNVGFGLGIVSVRAFCSRDSKPLAFLLFIARLIPETRFALMQLSFRRALRPFHLTLCHFSPSLSHLKIDTFFQEHKPSRHVIIEAHPDAITYAKSLGWDKKPGVEIWEGKWEDFMDSPEIGDFDVVYFDTYSQDYAGESQGGYFSLTLSRLDDDIEIAGGRQRERERERDLFFPLTEALFCSRNTFFLTFLSL